MMMGDGVKWRWGGGGQDYYYHNVDLSVPHSRIKGHFGATCLDSFR